MYNGRSRCTRSTQTHPPDHIITRVHHSETHPYHPQVALSIANHMQDLPDLTKSAKVVTIPNPTKEALTAAWKEWVEQAGMVS